MCWAQGSSHEYSSRNVDRENTNQMSSAFSLPHSLAAYHVFHQPFIPPFQSRKYLQKRRVVGGARERTDRKSLPRSCNWKFCHAARKYRMMLCEGTVGLQCHYLQNACVHASGCQHGEEQGERRTCGGVARRMYCCREAGDPLPHFSPSSVLCVCFLANVAWEATARSFFFSAHRAAHCSAYIAIL